MIISKAKGTFHKLRFFKWGLWLSLCALALFHAIYQTIRTFLISTDASASGIDAIGQMEWYGLIDETIKAFLIVLLYSNLNKIFKNDKEKGPSFVFKSLLAVSIIYFIFNVGIFIYGNSLISFMNLQENDISAISTYLKLETVTFMIGKMVNIVSEQGNYWVANNFIWGWLLIPVTALVEIIKTDCKEEDKKMIRSNYYFISLFIFVGGSTLPCWKLFLAYAERYVEFFNEERPSGALGYMTPKAYRELYGSKKGAAPKKPSKIKYEKKQKAIEEAKAEKNQSKVSTKR